MIVLRYSRAALFVLLAASIKLGLATDEAVHSHEQFPSIWSDSQDGSGKNGSAYRIWAEMQLSSMVQSFITEEWASSELQRFRLDMIEAQEGKRSTYMTYKDTNESFYFKPFQCKLVENFKDVLDPNLRDKLQPSDMTSRLMPIGVGALWLHALNSEASHVEPKECCHSGLCDDATHVHGISHCLESFAVPATNDYPFKMTFYFKTDHTTLVPESLDMILVDRVDVTTNFTETLMRIKILEIESSLRGALYRSPDLFDLPQGYGCQRSDHIDRTFEPSDNGLQDFYLVPNVLSLDIVAQLPAETEGELHKIHSWRSHSASVRMVAGRVTYGLKQQRDYMVAETRNLVPDKRFSGRRATMEGVRQVWDLGYGGFSVEAGVPKPRSLYYKLDDRQGKCLAFGESKLDASASIEFPGTGNGTAASEQATVKGLMLDVALLQSMFGSPKGYHQIWDGVSESKQGFRELIYERRLENFVMHNQRGELTWSGPVSFVRRHLLVRENAHNPNGQLEGHLPKLSSTIYFLSAQADQLLGKVHVALNDRRFINQAAFHEELQVEPCFSEGITAASGGHLDIKLDYPIESVAVAEALSDCVHSESMAKEQFLRAIYAVSQDRLDPMQVNGISLELIDSNLLKVSAKLMVRPNLLNYRREAGVKFSIAFRSLLLSEFHANEASCAESCAHYNCTAFTYCSDSSQCDLLLGGSQLLLSKSPEPSPRCALFKNRESLTDEARLRALEPIELVQLMREAIVRSEKDAYNPLGLWVSYTEDVEHSLYKTSQLLPTSIEIVGGGGGDRVKGSPHLLLRTEYELVLEHRRLGGDHHQAENSLIFPIPLAKYTSYDDCRDLCEQSDCKSFSHCQLERTCMVSQLHNTEMIKEHSEEADYCFVFAREWLSKFRGPVQVAKEAVASIWKADKELKVAETRDCASHCMEQQDFKCRSFYHCPPSDPPGPNSVNCYLSKRHLAPTAAAEFQGPLLSSAVSGEPCQLYTRSHLAEFDRFFERSLPEVGNDEDNEQTNFWSIVKPGLSAEACAVECAERHGKCQAFHVCHTRTGTHLVQKPICVLLTSKKPPPYNNNNDSLNWINPDKLIVNDDCTSFIVAEGSDLRQRRSLGNFEPVDDDDDKDSEDVVDGEMAEKEPNQFHVASQADEESDEPFFRAIVLVIGFTLGCGLALVWRRRRNH